MTWQRMRRLALVTVVFVALLFCIASWRVGTRLVAPANRAVGSPPDDLPAQTHVIASESGSQLAAWYVPHSRATATVVLAHPIRGNRSSMLSRARLLHESGFALLLIDLQAHGESPGAHITLGYLEKHDIRAAVEFAREMNPDHRIGVVGRSLGGAAALLASPLDIDALVLESVYPTITEAVYDRVDRRYGQMKQVLAPALLCQLKPRLGISTDDLRPIDYIDDVACPVLVVAGDLDEHTTIAESRRIFAQAAEPKKFVVFAGAGHVDLLKHDADKYQAEVLSFLLSHLLEKPTADSNHLPPK